MNLDDYHCRHDQAATLIAVLVAGLGCAGALLPVMEHAVNLALFGGAGLAVLLAALRTAARVVRERREDRADALAGAAWRAEHMPHPPTEVGSERAGTERPGVR
jgi:hypothetical protein